MKTYIVFEDRVYSVRDNVHREYYYGELVKSGETGMRGINCKLSNRANWQLVAARNASLAYQYAYLLKICKKSEALKAKDILNEQYASYILSGDRDDVAYPDWVKTLRTICLESTIPDLYVWQLLDTPLVYEYKYLKHLDRMPAKPKPKKAKPKPQKLKIDKLALSKNKKKTNAQTHSIFKKTQKF